MTIYCFSGLGADERAFQLLDFSNWTVIHVKWIDAQPNETLEHYAQRIGSVIDTTQPFVLLGLSFGGMLCVELAKTLNPSQVILLSSIAGRHEMPLRMKVSGAFNLYRLVPAKYFNQPSKIAHSLFGVKTQEEIHLLDQILKDSDAKFVKWALNAITQWKNTKVPNCFRIHGTEDRIFPYKLQTVDATISGGGHFMVVSHANEVSASIHKAISTKNVNSSCNSAEKQ